MVERVHVPDGGGDGYDDHHRGRRHLVDVAEQHEQHQRRRQVAKVRQQLEPTPARKSAADVRMFSIVAPGFSGWMIRAVMLPPMTNSTVMARYSAPPILATVLGDLMAQSSSARP